MNDKKYPIPGPRYHNNDLRLIKIALFDVDNSLVGNESAQLPSKHFQKAALGSKGKIKIALATARPLSKVAHILDYIQADGLSILCNGAQIYDNTKHKFIAEWSINNESAQYFLAKLQELQIHFWVNDDGVDYFPVKNDRQTYKYQSNIWDKASSHISVHDYAPNKPFIIVLNHLSEHEVTHIKQLVTKHHDPDIAAFVAHETRARQGGFTYDMFIVHKLANKHDALLKVMELQNLQPENVMALGDGRNDTVLVDSAGIGIAMGNAAIETLHVADFITTSLDHDGATLALEFLLDYHV